MNDWAMGITEFSTKDVYSSRSTEEECPQCGALPGYMCFEMSRDSRGYVKPFPTNSHIMLREIPIKNQALSSGRLRSGC